MSNLIIPDHARRECVVDLAITPEFKTDDRRALDWDEYTGWRKTKCRPYHYSAERISTSVLCPETPVLSDHDRILEEIDQATHEFVGEVSELGELMGKFGLGSLRHDPARSKVIDECGDILFCGHWVMDAWGDNPYHGPVADSRPFPPGADKAGSVNIGRMIREDAFPDPGWVNMAQTVLLATYSDMASHAGLLCNAFKKLRWQRRQQNVATQIGRVKWAFDRVGLVLALASSSIEEALATNITKLDARYPDGYQAGQGGGIRTGAGA